MATVSIGGSQGGFRSLASGGVGAGNPLRPFNLHVVISFVGVKMLVMVLT